MALIPEKRVDRNGRVVTKHVRPVAARSFQALIPSPAAAPAAKPKRLPVARTRPVLWDVYKSQCGADRELVDASSSFAPGLSYSFEASDAEVYEVMSRVSPENVTPLLACGIRTGDEAVAFLKSKSLERLIEDNAAFAEQALAYNIPAQIIKEFRASYPEDTADNNPSYFEAVEIFSLKGFRESRHIPRLTELVLKGRVSSEDLKTLGLKRVNAGGAGSTIVGQLQKINNGQSKMNAEELAAIITKATNDGAGNSTIINETVSLADHRGYEFVMKLEQPVLAAQLDKTLTAVQYDQSSIEDIMLWHDKLRHGTNLGHVPSHQVTEMFEAGVQPEDAAAGLKEKLSTEQIIGIYVNGVPKAVSGGWL